MKIIANIATIREREKNLFNTVESLLPQVDAIHICYNGYKPSHDWPDKVMWSVKDNSKGDAGKFFLYCQAPQAFDVWFFCDDDLIYPADYVEKSLKRLKQFPKDVLSYHGRRLKPRPIGSYYNRHRVSGYRCLADVPNDVCFGHDGTLGTGVMFFNSGTLDIDWNWFEHPNMADIWLAKFAIEQKKRMIVLKHEEGWIRPQPVRSGIWEGAQHDDRIQAEVYNSIKV